MILMAQGIFYQKGSELAMFVLLQLVPFTGKWKYSRLSQTGGIPLRRAECIQPGNRSQSKGLSGTPGFLPKEAVDIHHGKWETLQT